VDLAAILLVVVACVVILLILDLALAGRGFAGRGLKGVMVGSTTGTASSGIGPILVLLSTILIVLVAALAFKVI
jgi:hypothetical protein